MTATNWNPCVGSVLSTNVASVQATPQWPLDEMAQEFASAVDAYVCFVSVPWASTLSRVASCERTLRTTATSSVGWTASATAARYVGPLPAGVVCTLNVAALMYATRPLVGLAVQTKFPVATGALNWFSAFISGGRAAPESPSKPLPA